MKTKNKKIASMITSLLLLTMFSTPITADTETHDRTPQPKNYHLEEEATQPVYDYDNAIKETIYVESNMDSDRDGNLDRIAADIIRPQETDQELQVPIIMDASPYYESIGRGNESETKDPDGDGVNEKFPLFYDNYFVPRGYAVVQVDMVGTNNSDGCPPTGGYEETESVNVVIDWLNGEGTAWDENGQEIQANWSTGKVGMIGKSYDGTLANAAAATGIDGLETIVPIGAISSWYDYYRYGGIPFYRNGPSGLSHAVTASERIEPCAVVREEIRNDADDQTGNYNSFWDERNFVKDAENVEASVFVIHGLNDYNVKANHFSNWWDALTNHDVPRKLWLTQTGHVDPFDFRRAEWVDTLHQWFDYWLLDIDNGIMNEPMVDIERTADEWETTGNWPNEGAEPVTIRLAPENEEVPGSLMTSPILGEFTQSFIDNPEQTEQQMVEDEFTAKENRLMYLSPELKDEVQLSGVPKLNINASIDQDDSNLTALIVDYGTTERVNHRDRGEGIRTLDSESCWGASTDVDDACYKETEKTTHVAPYEIVSHGWLDVQNWDGLEHAAPVEPGKTYTFQWDMLPEDYIFQEGHRIGVIIAGSDDQMLMPDNNQASFDVTLGDSSISLPVVGGKQTLDKAFDYKGGTSPENVADMKKIISIYQEEDAFANPGVARSLLTHLTAVERFEEQQATDKFMKHMKGFQRLIEKKWENKQIARQAYQVLTIDAASLLNKWEN
ncbi:MULTISPECIES: Xaa-Pro dipeptidyl-peptidase [Virgibacillus]|uniref:Xaa-Pro dipeptidyl-peptidase n=1 Tax=Virgibacillus TaxID=84406 RepID=UPI0003882338|nr:MULTISPECIES: Xaa-Pro dipeptidyl-peptidase [Virgibacillus]EQB38576.1 hypothetical protein M948_08295 [Virgibacillus sp. CM-4]